jgi:alpha-L-arabinofuranosidase
VINLGSDAVTAQLNFGSVRPVGDARVTVLNSADLSDNNSLEQPQKVIPSEQKLMIGDQPAHEFPPNSLTILRMKIR